MSTKRSTPYDCGLCLMKCMHLRAKENVFDKSQIIVREGKGEKGQATMIYAHVLSREYKSVSSPLD